MSTPTIPFLRMLRSLAVHMVTALDERPCEADIHSPRMARYGPAPMLADRRALLTRFALDPTDH
ncbi:MAG: hypothetical protein KDB86_06600 [Actinobacteria bacterium]|nr:hypothetical protein [Actinomycetota bacterium]